MQVKIITPEHTAFADEATSVTVPTLAGEITVLPHHIPLVSTLVPGTIVVRSKAGEQLFAVSRGVVEIDGEAVRILSDMAERPEHMEEEAITKAVTAAEKLKAEKREDEEGFAEATAILAREIARLKSVRRHRAGGHVRSPTSLS
jgi:F-type H+-transporting ATPase subunit epsilon